MTTKKTTRKTAKPKLPSLTDLAARDANGLISGLKHQFREDGFVDWKRMIPKEFVVPNEEVTTVEGADASDVDELEDYQKLVLLGGTKELAKIRGLISRKTKIDYVGDYKAVATCELTFVGNYETGGIPLVYSDSASATVDNTGSLGSMYLETIASNRALVRAVRNALNVHILSAEEINVKPSGQSAMSEEEAMAAGNKPTDILAEKAKVVGYPIFEQFKEKLVSNGGVKNIPLETVESWTEWKDIDPKHVWILIPLLNKKKKK